MQIQPINPLTHPDFQSLLKISTDEGYSFTQKLLDEYESGVNRFDSSGAALLGVSADQQLIAIGGAHPDTYVNQPQIGRIRHVYVLPDYRRTGVGKLIMEALIDHARAHFEILTLRTPTAHGDAFYTALGFSREVRFAESTHWLALKGESLT